jgi:uncharacterized protein YndB with AHSA1/START domain
VKFRHSITINLPVADVFEYLSDFRHSTVWAGPVLVTHWLENESSFPQMGSSYRQLIKFLERQLEVTFQIIEFEPDHLITSKTIAGWLPSLVSYVTEPLAGGTNLTCTQETELSNQFKRFEPVLQKSLERQLRQDLTNLKDWLESGLYTQI